MVPSAMLGCWATDRSLGTLQGMGEAEGADETLTEMPEIFHRCSDTSLLLPDIHEQNVAFVVCYSENKPSKLRILKELLIKTLFSLASKPTYFMFNIVNGANKVLRWQESLVTCSLISIAEAAAWIRALPCNSEVNACSAVVAALEDPTCQAVYLFTSGLPECTTEEIHNHLRKAGEARPLHIVFLVGNGEENGSASQEMLEKLAKDSGGSFQVTSLCFDGTSDEENPGCIVGVNCGDCISKQHCSVLPPGDCTKTHFARNPDSPNTFLRSLTMEDLGDWSPTINEFQRGLRVLARKETDGYYYLSHIVQGVKGSRDCVLIEFERSQRSSKGKAQLPMQETPLYDIIHHEDARWQPLAPGDRVLAPFEKKGERYGPGIVLQVEEAGLSHSAFKNSNVLVNFWNGQTKKVPVDVAVKIPPPLSERIVLELQMPLSARQMLVEQSPDYPSVVPPGYRASGPCRQNHFGQICWQGTPKHVARCISPFCRFWLPAWEPVRSPGCKIRSDSALMPGTSLTKEELSRKIEEQLSKGRPTVSTNTESEKEENRKPKRDENIADLKPCEVMESNTTNPNKDPHREQALEEPKECTGTMMDVAVNTDKSLAWQKQKGFSQPNTSDSLAQCSRRSPSWKTYAAGTSQLQTMFDRVNQPLKKDRSAIESVLHIRRSTSVPSMQKLAVKEAPQKDSGKIDSDTARAEFKLQKWEQRRHKEEEKKQEEHLRKELQLDKKRQRSLQRSLQALQKQQETSDRAGQRMEKLQIARTEKKRQESDLVEKERDKESQRVAFLKTQREQREKGLTERNQSIEDHEKKRLDLLRKRVQSVQKHLEVAVQEQDAQQREREAAKRQTLQKRGQMSQQVAKESQKHRDLQLFLKEQSLLALRASLLP